MISLLEWYCNDMLSIEDTYELKYDVDWIVKFQIKMMSVSLAFKISKVEGAIIFIYLDRKNLM